MPVRPPSLRAIAAFEAAARHESFTKAADELNLTQSAISHAVRSLELRLGMDLFERYGRTVVLTEAGRAFVSRLRLSLNLISEAFDVQPRPGSRRLVVGAGPGVLERVLAPRLGALDRTLEQFEFRQVSDHQEAASGEVDVAILFGAGACAGLVRRRLAGEALFPVIAAGAEAPRRPEELARMDLIHQPAYPWRLWFEQLGLGDVAISTPLTVDNPAAAIELARGGAGVCLARGLLAREDLNAGRLVRLFEAEVALREDYSAVWSAASPRADLIEPFVEWLAAALDPGPTRTLRAA